MNNEDNFFLINSSDNIHCRYAELLEKINFANSFDLYFKGNNIVDFYINLLLSLINNRDIYLLDFDLSDAERNNFVSDLNPNLKEFKNNYKLESLNSLINRVIKSSSNIVLYTSGTTGKPKEVKHSISNLLRFVKTTDKHQDNIWGLCYNPTHIAGLQVFIQAFLNTNPLVYLFGSPKQNIIRDLETYNVSHISATPTFYRLLLPPDFENTKVKRITIGGEKSDNSLYQNLNKVFPNAKILNVYASTEAGTIFASKGDVFIIDDTISSKIQINEAGELFVHKSLVGSFSNQQEWYNTGDIVEFTNDTKTEFRFKGRNDDNINVGGYNVNLNEISETVLEISGIINANVYARKNSVVSNLIVCEIVKDSNYDITEKDIIDYLSNKLQAYKIPRIVKFVDKIELTRTGKIKKQ